MSNDSESPSGRPLDVLEASLGEKATVRLKSGGGFTGELGGYDQHLNVVLSALEVGEDDNETASEELEPGVEAVEKTVVIRGDNVVSIMV